MAKIGKCLDGNLARACLLAVALTLGSAPAFAIDCASARSYVERQICTHEVHDIRDLAELDERMASEYRAVAEQLPSASERKRLLDAQRDWLTRRERCRSPECISQATQARADELQAWRTVGSHRSAWIAVGDVEDEDAGLCSTLLKTLNQRRDSSAVAPSCPSLALLRDVGAGALPWRAVDPESHRALLEKLMLFDAVGADAYFHRRSSGDRSADLAPDALAAIARQVDAFITSGRAMQALSGPIFGKYVQDAAHAPTGAAGRTQTIVRLADDRHPCSFDGSRELESRFAGRTHLVEPDLSGPLATQLSLMLDDTAYLFSMGDRWLAAGGGDSDVSIEDIRAGWDVCRFKLIHIDTGK